MTTADGFPWRPTCRGCDGKGYNEKKDPLDSTKTVEIEQCEECEGDGKAPADWQTRSDYEGETCPECGDAHETADPILGISRGEALARRNELQSVWSVYIEATLDNWLLYLEKRSEELRKVADPVKVEIPKKKLRIRFETIVDVEADPVELDDILSEICLNLNDHVQSELPEHFEIGVEKADTTAETVDPSET